MMFSTKDKVYITLFVISITINAVILFSNLRRFLVKSSDSEKINTLLRQSARYGVAALQDENEAIAVLHSNYAVAYVDSVTDIYSETSIKDFVGVDIQKFKKEIKDIQDRVTKNIYKACPAVIPKKISKTLLDFSQGN